MNRNCNNVVYILKLQHDKFYVGKTTNINRRYQEHLDGNGAEWTKLFKPVQLLQTIELVGDFSDFYEDLYTKKYMKMYGVANVRGGSYCSIELSKETINFINRELWHSAGLCLNCGKKHFSEVCNQQKLWTPNGVIVKKEKHTFDSVTEKYFKDLAYDKILDKIKYYRKKYKDIPIEVKNIFSIYENESLLKDILEKKEMNKITESIVGSLDL